MGIVIKKYQETMNNINICCIIAEVIVNKFVQ